MASHSTDVPVREIHAIDVHGHYGNYIVSPPVPTHPLKCEFMTGSAEVVAQRGRAANTQWTVVSPLLALFPRGGADAAVGNNEASRIVPATPGLLQWIVIDPRRPATYEQARKALGHWPCVGIKIHPEEHVYPISEHGDAIFSFAAEHKAVVLTHTGEHNSMPEAFVPFANAYPETRIILAHIGNAWDGDPSHQVRAIQQGKHGNLFADTSSAQSIMPKLIEFAVREVGAERVLYGTDTPLYSASMQRARIDLADLSDADKRLILRGNAVKLLNLPKD